MSTTIDERVVGLEFDNSQFESGVKTSLQSLETFNNALNMKGATAGLEGVDSAINKIDLSPLASAAESVAVKFSALQIAGITAISNITNSAVNAGKKIVSALTIDPIKTGFSEYETQINSVQTILANTAKEGTNINTVNAALDELNTYADKTIYNFTEMTRNIGTFTAAGVELDTSVQAIKGIANLAAVSGSNAQQASTAMYQLSQALSSGTVRLMDWNSVVNAGMGGQVFQDALKETARNNGVAIDSMIDQYGSFRETLQTGWLSADVLTETLSKFTGDLSETQLAEMGYSEEQIKEIIELGEMANDAATKVKTLTQLFDTLKEAAQSGWSQSWRIIIGDFEEAKELFTEVSDVIGGMIGASADARNQLLTDGLGTSWDQLMSQGISDEASYAAILDEEAAKIIENYDEIIEEHKDFQTAVEKGAISTADATFLMSDALRLLAEENRNLTEEEIKNKGYTQEQVDELLALNTAARNGTVNIRDFAESLTKVSGRDNLINALRNAFYAVLEVIKPVQEAFKDLFPSWTGEQLYDLTENIFKFSENLKISEETADKIKKTFSGLFSILKVGQNVIFTMVGFVASFADEALYLADGVLTVTAAIGEWLTGISNGINDTSTFTDMISSLKTNLEKFIGFVTESFVFPGLSMLAGVFESLTSNMTGATSTLDELSEKVNIFESLLNNPFIKLFDTIVKGLGAGLKYLVEEFKEGVAGLLETLSEITFADIVEVINAISVGAIAGGIAGFLHSLFDAFSAVREASYSIGDILDEVKVSLEVWQNSINAQTLLTIAGAIGVLAISLFVISTIDPKKLVAALGGVGVLMAELIGAMAALNAVGGMGKGVISSVSTMIAISVATLILASALVKLAELDYNSLGPGLAGLAGIMTGLTLMMKTLSSDGGTSVKGAFQFIFLALAIKILAGALMDLSVLSWNDLAVGLGGLLGIMIILSGFTAISNIDKEIMSVAGGMILLAIALKILADVAIDLAGLSWDELAKGLGGLLGMMIILAGFTSIADSSGNMISTGLGMIFLGLAMKILASALQDMVGLEWADIGKGLYAIGMSLAMITLAMNFLPKNMIANAVGLVLVAGAIFVLTQSLQAMSGMSWEDVGKGLLVLGGSLFILAAALNLMAYTLGGAVALTVAAGALALLVPTMLILGSMDLGTIGKSLLFLAGTLGVLAIASIVFSTMAPAIFITSAALMALAVSVALIGAGLLMMSAAITAFSAAGTVAFSAFFANIYIIVGGIIGLIPTIAVAIGQGILAILGVIADAGVFIIETVVKIGGALLEAVIELAPKIFETVEVLLTGLLNLLVTMSPIFISTVFTLLNNLILGLIEYTPILTQSVMTLMITMINTLATTISDNQPLVSEAIGNLVLAIVNALVQFALDAVQLGKDIISGLVSGVWQMAQSLIDSVIGVVDGAIQAAKNLLGINSPSRVFMEFGRFMDIGMANGLDKYAKVVSKSSEGVANEATTSMKTALDKAISLLDNELDAQPTIRPVMDLSDVAKGVNELNNSIPASSVVGIDADVSNNKSGNQNGSSTGESSDSDKGGVTFNQYNSSPKALSRIEIYRQTNNLISKTKNPEGTPV